MMTYHKNVLGKWRFMMGGGGGRQDPKGRAFPANPELDKTDLESELCVVFFFFFNFGWFCFVQALEMVDPGMA